MDEQVIELVRHEINALDVHIQNQHYTEAYGCITLLDKLFKIGYMPDDFDKQATAYYIVEVTYWILAHLDEWPF